jgi:hypothetical protein
MQAPRLLFAVAVPAVLSFGSLAACSLTSLEDPASASAPARAPAPPGLGLACAVDAQCASHRCSADIADGSCGVCVDPRKLGERCDGPLQGCNPSAICDQGVCKSTMKTLGETCGIYGKGGDRGECDVELYCAEVGGGGLERGMCMPLIPVGEVCNLVLWTGACVGSAYCSRSAGICVLSSSNRCDESSCGGGSFCDSDGTCRPMTLALDAPCLAANGDFLDDECVAGTMCGGRQSPKAEGGTEWIRVCVALPLQGESCLAERCAPGLFCVHEVDEGTSTDPTSTRCEVQRGEGEACTTRGACVAGLECRGKVCMQPCR